MTRSIATFALVTISFFCIPVTAQSFDDAPAAGQLTDAHITRAIDDLKSYLYSIQQPSGSWDDHYASVYPGGETALVVYALLAAGESAQHPQLAKAIDWLEQVDMQKVYCRALRLHVWGQLPDRYRKNMSKDAQWLLSASHANEQGLFTYQPKPGNYDHSNTQYGVLGLWEASKRNVKVPRRFWQRIGNHFIASISQPDGGWGYRANAPTDRGSMTCAGLTAMIIADQQLNRHALRPKKQYAATIEQGFRWMNRNFNGHRNPGGGAGYTYYYLYGVERVGLAGGYRYFNGQDWFEVGARYIISNIRVAAQGQTREARFSANVPDTAFALLFLARGRVPVWVGKLAIPGQSWNLRPYDIDLFTRYVSSLREGEMNWQLLDINQPVQTWLYTPLAWLSIDQPLELDDHQMQQLRQYLDFGGMLLINPQQNTSVVKGSVRVTLEKMYPQTTYQWRPLPADHPVYTSLHQLGQHAEKHPIMGLTNGVRELVLMPGDDWGKTFQTQSPGERIVHWQLMTNVFALVTSRGHMGGRLDTPHEPAAQRSPSGEMVVGRVRHGGNWNPEPATWVPAATRLFNRTGLQMSLQAVDAAALGDCPFKLVHLAAVESVSLSNDELDAIAAYVNAGGTLLIETPGGRGQFSHSVAAQLSKALGAAPGRLNQDSPIYTGKGLRGGYDCTSLQPRRTSVLDIQQSRVSNELQAVYVDGRPAVIISHDDLALGLLGVRQWGIRGWTRESTRELVTNLLVWVNQR